MSDSHKHKCSNAGCPFLLKNGRPYIWQHPDSSLNNHSLHTCPHCRTKQWYMYLGSKPPDDILPVTQTCLKSETKIAQPNPVAILMRLLRL